MTSAPGDLWAVIPAGGAGTRLWPVSGRERPKFLHDLTAGGRSLLQATVDRLAPLVADRMLVVVGAAHQDAVAAQLPDLPRSALLVEPAPRDSMAAIGLAAAVLERRSPDAVLGSFAADHVIADAAAFRSRVRAAAAVARDGWLVTIGIAPTGPATGFGYLRLGDPLPGHPGVRRVERFAEKPSPAAAAEFVARGDLWNAGMFVARPTVLLGLLAEQDPAFAAALRRIAADPATIEWEWAGLPRISVDHAVAEPAADAGRVAVVPADFGWRDIGDFDSLAELLSHGESGGSESDSGGTGDHRGPGSGEQLAVLGDEGLVHALDASGLVVPASGRIVAVVGMEDVIVVDTPEALLVTTRARAQDVKRIAERLDTPTAEGGQAVRRGQAAEGDQTAPGSGESM